VAERGPDTAEAWLKGALARKDKIMGFELSRALAYERIRHSAELSPRLAQLLDAGMAIGAEE